MKTLHGILVTIALATSVFAQTGSSAPPITQLFDFSCNANFSFCPQGFDPTLSPVQIANGNFYGVTWWARAAPATAGRYGKRRQPAASPHCTRFNLTRQASFLRARTR